MSSYTKEELEGALRAIISLLGKCEKAREKMPLDKAHASQVTLLNNRIEALRIASSLIKKESAELIS
ncbi:MAG: hypothetical protein ACM3U1_00490 [Chloroflexota bacterium]